LSFLVLDLVKVQIVNIWYKVAYIQKLSTHYRQVYHRVELANGGDDIVELDELPDSDESLAIDDDLTGTRED